ncbi:MAG TPA: (deoxy)nucleoside triphosphate pyrophosphohydrolase [Deltaproteobacteria bacterium]|nr:(deoxy)nucleoside triphosphate pyrophosphohydrolase [Deltaproteobacteria bacterium]
MTIRVVAGVWIQGGRVLGALRRPDQARGGLWELPGGKVEPGETDRRALARELAEELGVDVEVAQRPLGEHHHDYKDVQIHLIAYQVAARPGSPEPVAREHAQLRWLDRRALGQVAWAPADVALLGAVRRALSAETDLD